MKFDEIISGLRNKVYHPVYFLQGEEPYYIDQVSSFIENNVLSESEKEFNQTILYGRDCDVAQVLGIAKRYPMASNYQVVIIKEAQDLKNLISKESEGKKNKKGEQEETKNLLFDYLLNPQKSTLLVFCYKYKSVDGRTKAGKLIEKKSVFFDSKKIYDNQLAAWITSYLKSKGYGIEEKTAWLISEHIGNDLARITNELNKLCLNISKKTIINSSLVETYIGISKDYNIFELQHAIGVKDILKANKIINYFAANAKSHPFILTLTNLYGFFNKLMLFHYLSDKSEKNAAAEIEVSFYFIRNYIRAAAHYKPQKLIQIFSWLREYDMRSKGVGNESADEGALLKEMVYKILH